MKNNWVIYGAYGYTGKLIVEDALRKGHRPTLAGRSTQNLVPLAEKHNLPAATIALDDEMELTRILKDFALVLNAAGPFSNTAEPLLHACLQTGAHYLDISGSLANFETVFSYNRQAQECGILLLPGAAFAVIASDCLAAYVAAQADRPNRLEIATHTSITTQPSPGTAKTFIESLPGGILARQGGRLVPVSPGKMIKTIRFPDRVRTILPTTLGDLVSAYHTTGVPDINTYVAFPEKNLENYLRAEPILRKLYGIPMIRRMAQKQAAKTARGPGEDERQNGRSYVWASATGSDGAILQAWLETHEAYRFTAIAALLCVEKILSKPLRGALSPAAAFGADFVLEIPGSKRFDRLPDHGQIHENKGL